MLIVLWIVGALLLAGAGYVLHRWLCSLERRGYIYYRERSRSGGSAMFELDKLIRPSIEHVVEARDQKLESQEHDGE